jgi:hypothetical protein
MAVKINNIEYSGFFFNGEALTAMYLNGNKVYGGGEHVYDPLIDSKYFVVKANSAITLSVYYDNSPTSTIYYKKNGEDNWTTITGDTNVILSQGDYLEMKGDVDNTGNAYVYFHTGLSDNIDIGGCIMALNQNAEITSSSLNQLTNTYTFYRLFDRCEGLVSAEHLTMASNTTSSCYQQMFQGCTALTTAPSLPSKTLANSCYSYMFADCMSLVNPPSLPAKTLANNCYMNMFYGCTSLTSAPSLPAITLASSCYMTMFRGCTALATAPTLSATTLADDCYYGMFQDCTALTIAPTLSATTLADSCYCGMFQDCTALTIAPSLPATTLTSNCYRSMFFGCTSLVNPPQLPATTLVTYCYMAMFRGCTALTSLTVSFMSISSNGISGWLNNVDTVGTLYCPTMATYSESDLTLPSGWTISKTVWVEMEQNISYDGVDVIVTGTTKALNASTNAAGATLTYSSSNPNVASIDSNGDIVALTTGTTTITITASAWDDNVNLIHYPSATTTVEVTVKESYNPLIDSGYLVIKANTATTLTIQAVGITVASYGKISYRKNGGAWSEATTGTSNTSISLTSGDYVEMKGNINNSSSKYYRFSTDTASSIETGGCLMALINDTKIDSTNNTFSTNKTFYNLYSGCTGLVSAEYLKLADNVKIECYRNMFRGCSNLTKACQLPAMTVDAANAYTSMFNSCTSLTTAPSLPATTVTGSRAYSYMFENCTSLTSVPNLPCTNPASDAYRAMFKTCTALVNGPEIMSTSTASGQFRDMFSGCTSLTNVTVHLSDGSKVYSNWLSGVRTTGTLYCPSTATGTFSIPSTWTLSKTLSS